MKKSTKNMLMYAGLGFLGYVLFIKKPQEKAVEKAVENATEEAAAQNGYFMF